MVNEMIIAGDVLRAVVSVGSVPNGSNDPSRDDEVRIHPIYGLKQSVTFTLRFTGVREMKEI
jgi:hypothetical protein